jgi:hypothetical protein
MKTQRFQKTLAVAVATGLALLALNAPAQNAAGPTAQILKLEQAKVSDDTIIAYIKNSGINYNLNADQIISLHQQGVSDAVLTAMLSQPRPAAVTATVPAPASPPSQTYSTTIPADTAMATDQPAAAYVQTVPTTYYYYSYSAPYFYYYPAFYSPIYGSYGWRRCPPSFHWNGPWRGGVWRGGATWNGGNQWYGGTAWTGNGNWHGGGMMRGGNMPGGVMMHGGNMMQNGGNWHGGGAGNGGGMMHTGGGGWHR